MLGRMIVSFSLISGYLSAELLMQKSQLAKGILCTLTECCSVLRLPHLQQQPTCDVAEGGEMHQTKQPKITSR